MKKLLGILVLGLLLSVNAYAKEIYLNCSSYRVVGYYKNGSISDEPGGSDDLKSTFKINTHKERIYEFNNVSNKFYERENVDWSEALISWKRDWGDLISVNKINRFDLTYKTESIYTSDPTWKKLDTYYNCNVGEKKF
jgi:hypothetical protein